MADRASATATGRWLMEHYDPGTDSPELHRRVERLRRAVAAADRAGTTVRIESAAVVPADEGFLCVVTAPSEAVVRAICRRGRVRLDRLVQVERAEDRSTED